MSFDGGTLRATSTAGPFVVTLFTSPEPLCAGLVDVSVLLQEPGSGAAILDATVTLHLKLAGRSFEARATREAATNRLLYAASLRLETEGLWHLTVEAESGARRATAACELPVAAPLPRLLEIAPLLAIPPIAVALFALGLGLRARAARKGARVP